MASRVCVETSMARSLRIGDVTDVDLNGRHPSQSQQIPRPTMRPAIP